MRKLTRAGIATLAASFAVVCGSAVVASTVMAREGSDTSTDRTAEIHDQADNDTQSHSGNEHKLAAAKLLACKAREKGIDNAMNRIAARGQRHLNLISEIATRAENFYTAKGHTLANYDALVADVTAKKTAAQTAVDNVKNNSTGFNCTGNDPKGVATGFAAKVKAMNTALKDYKTSVKTLIKGIKSVQPSNDSTEGSNQ